MTFRGHTPSDWPGEYSYQNMFSDTEELLDALAVRDAAVLGHSLGGMVAQTALRRRPDGYAAAILSGTSPAFTIRSASGIMIALIRPYHLGDFVELNGETGTVIDLDLFFTKLRSPEEPGRSS